MSENPREDLVARNWSFLHSHLQEAIALLDFSLTKERAPRNRLGKIQEVLREMEARIIQQKITRLGHFPVRSEIGYVINTVRGMRQGILDGELTEKSFNALAPKLCDRLRNITIELTVRAEREAHDLSRATAHARAASTQTTEKIEQIAAKVKHKSKDQKAVILHRNIQEAMAALQKNNEKAIKEEARKASAAADKEQQDSDAKVLANLKALGTGVKKPVKAMELPGVPDFEKSRTRETQLTPEQEKKAAELNRDRQRIMQRDIPPDESPSVFQIRDAHSIDQVVHQFDPDLERMIKVVREAGLHSTNALNFVVLRGPVVLISGHPPSRRALETAGMPYTILRHDSNKPEPAVMHKIKREHIPHDVIFHSQVLVALGTLPRKKVPPPPAPSRKPRLPPKNTDNSKTYSEEEYALRRKQICATLNAKVGGKWIDILAESSHAKTKFVVSPHFPHTRFVWLMEEAKYAKLGSFTIDHVGFPFESKEVKKAVND